MEVNAIPIENKFILYRPLLRLAFVGNRAMADLVLDLAGQEFRADDGAPEEAMTFLRAIGFFEPDPPPPPPPDRSYHPATAVLLLTNRCNLRCTYCYARGGEGPTQDLSLEIAQEAIDHVCRSAKESNQPCFEVAFHGGGEPVQAWDTLQEATTYARGRDLPCRLSLVSNGVWTTRQREWIIKNLDGVTISLDGRPETQDRRRPLASGQGSSTAVMRTVRALDKTGFPYGVRMTATAPWRGQLPQDVGYICEETGCQVMQVEPAFNIRRGRHQRPTLDESQAFVDAFMESFEIAQQAGRQVTYSGARPWLLTRTFCTAPYNALIVNAAGNLVTCYEIASEAHTLAKMSTVGHVVDSQVAPDQQARDALLAYLAERRDTCRECFCFWHCAGDCYTRSFDAEANRAHGPGSSSRCLINRGITARILLWYIMAGDGVWRGQTLHPQETQLYRVF